MSLLKQMEHTLTSIKIWGSLAIFCPENAQKIESVRLQIITGLTLGFVQTLPPIQCM